MRALEAGAAVTEVYAAPELFLGDRDAGLVAQAERRGARIFELSAAAFASISGAVRADGLAAVVARWPTGLGRLRLSERPLLLVAESVERPGNLGAIVRAACAAGADALLICDGRVGPFHPEAVRGSVGTLFDIALAEAPSAAAVGWLRAGGVRVIAGTPDGTRACWDADLTGPVALVVGSERHGVSRTWLDAADETIRIPMPEPADSLNVAVAAGVVLYEAVRQRAAAG